MKRIKQVIYRVSLPLAGWGLSFFISALLAEKTMWIFWVVESTLGLITFGMGYILVITNQEQH